MEDKTRTTTAKEINGILYIVETRESDSAKETAYTKVKKLILNHIPDTAELSESTQKVFLN